MHKIVIVGGGAGGLELATRLGKAYRRDKKVNVTLVDKNRTHIWKPKLHEIASGSMDFGDHEVDYMAHAHWNHFIFRIGELKGLDRLSKTIDLAPYLDAENTPVTPVQKIEYDTLVICIGRRNMLSSLKIKRMPSCFIPKWLTHVSALITNLN